jgi:hypothetical protein
MVPFLTSSASEPFSARLIFSAVTTISLLTASASFAGVDGPFGSPMQFEIGVPDEPPEFTVWQEPNPIGSLPLSGSFAKYWRP